MDELKKQIFQLLNESNIPVEAMKYVVREVYLEVERADQEQKLKLQQEEQEQQEEKEHDS